MIHKMNETEEVERISLKRLRDRRRLVGARIAELRGARKWSQRELASRLDIPSGRLSRIETGQADPLFRDLLRMREVFGVPLDALVAGASGTGTLVADVRLRDLLHRIERAASPELRDSLVAVLRPVVAGLRSGEAAGPLILASTSPTYRLQNPR